MSERALEVRLNRLEHELRELQRRGPHGIGPDAWQSAAGNHAHTALYQPMLPGYVDWTPTVTQGGAVSVTVTEAKYAVIGKVCHLYARVVTTATGTAGNAILIGGLPAGATPAIPDGSDAGGGFLNRGATYHAGRLYYATGSGFYIMAEGQSGGLGASPSFGLGIGDVIRLNATYRVA